MRTRRETPVPSARWAHLRKRLKESAKWYPFIVPNMIIFVVFNMLAWVFLGYLAFHSWDMLTPPEFIGLNHFARMASDRLLFISLKNTLVYALIYVPLGAAIPLFLAILVNSRLRGVKLFRSIYFLPVVTSVSVLALIWLRLFSPREDAPVNALLGLLGIPPQRWLLDLKQAMLTVIGMRLWAGFGYQMILWLAGLQGIPEELYDAAQVDGASAVQRAWFITLPLLRPTAVFIIVVMTIGSLQVFNDIYILTRGGPVRATTTIVWYIWTLAFDLTKMGYASTVSILLFVIILIITIIQRRLLHTEQIL